MNKEYKLLMHVFIMTFILGLFAYGYAFTCYTPAHDGIMTITHDQGWQTSIGRGLMQVYVKFRGPVDSPWFIGILSLGYTAVAAYLTVKSLGINDDLWKIFAIVSVYVLNIAYVVSATIFMYLWDIYAMALLLSVLAFYIFVKSNNWIIGIIGASITLSFSMGLYQSYFAVTVGLFIIFFIIETVKEEKSFKQQMVLVAEEIVILAMGAIIYGVTLKAIQKVTNVIPVDSYNSVSNLSNLSFMSMVSSIPDCYKGFFDFFFKTQPYASKIFSIINICLTIGAVGAYAIEFCKLKRNIDRVFLGMAIIAFPLGVNCIYILSGGMIHSIMVFSYQIFYILILLPVLCNDFEFLKKGGVLQRRIVTVFGLALSFVIIRFSNGILYYQKLVGEGTRVSVTNVLYDIERNTEFDPDSMKILVVGKPGDAFSQDYEMRDLYDNNIGIAGSTITYDSVFGDYMHYILGRNYLFDYSEEDVIYIKKTEEYEAMASYPQDGYIRVIDNFLVIKFDTD